MKLIELFKKDYIVGLDIGTSSINIVQFVKKEDGLHLVKADLKEIKQVNDDALREAEIISILKDLLKGIDVRRSKVIANINCPRTAVKKVTVPYMSIAELREGIKMEAKNYFPFPIDDALLDFEILGDVFEKGIRKYDVVVAISPRKTVDRYLAILKKAGIKPVSLICNSCALRILAEKLFAAEDHTDCFIDIGELYTDLVISSAKNSPVSGGKRHGLVFSRKIPIGGADFTKALTGALVSDKGKIELSLDEAEKIKRQVGIPSEDESKVIEDKISTTQILSMLRAPLRQFVDEIERCFDYYREETTGEKIDSIILFGGGASLGNFAKYLSEELGIEVRLGNPLENLKVEKDAMLKREKISHRLALAIGAALSDAKGINLLPPEIKEETKRTFKRATIQAIVTAATLISIFVYTGMKIQLSNFEKRISVAKLELSSLRFQLKKAETQYLANVVFVGEPHWEDVFKELSNLIPDDIYLTEMDMEGKAIIMRGMAASENGEELLSNFILTLENGIFKNVKLVKVEDLEGGVGNRFELKCWVD